MDKAGPPFFDSSHASPLTSIFIVSTLSNARLPLLSYLNLSNTKISRGMGRTALSVWQATVS